MSSSPTKVIYTALADGDTLVYHAATDTWVNSPPSGGGGGGGGMVALQRFGAPPVGNVILDYDFSTAGATLTDDSASAYHLNRVGVPATTRKEVRRGLMGMKFDGTTYYGDPGYDVPAAVRTTGAFTINMIIAPTAYNRPNIGAAGKRNDQAPWTTTATVFNQYPFSWLFSCGANVINNGLINWNCFYRVAIGATSTVPAASPDLNFTTFYSHYNALTIPSSQEYFYSQHPPPFNSEPYMLSFTRVASALAVNMYINAVLVDTFTLANPPLYSGASSARFYLGAGQPENVSGSQGWRCYQGWMGAFQMIDTNLSTAQLETMADAVGLLYT